MLFERIWLAGFKSLAGRANTFGKEYLQSFPKNRRQTYLTSKFAVVSDYERIV